MPHILLRFMAIEDHNKLKLSRRIAVIWVVIAMGVAILIGIIGNAMTKVARFPFWRQCIRNDYRMHFRPAEQAWLLAAIVAGIVLSGILAATMSTADSQLLAASSSISHNLLGGFFRVNISERRQCRRQEFPFW
mgnify:CR=1 FL=1